MIMTKCEGNKGVGGIVITDHYTKVSTLLLFLLKLFLCHQAIAPLKIIYIFGGSTFKTSLSSYLSFWV